MRISQPTSASRSRWFFYGANGHDRGHYPKARDIHIGDHPKKNDFVVASDALTSDQFPLVKADGDSFLVTWNESMTIEVRNESGEILNGAELAQRNLVTRLTSPSKSVANTK